MQEGKQISKSSEKECSEKQKESKYKINEKMGIETTARRVAAEQHMDTFQ